MSANILISTLCPCSSKTCFSIPVPYPPQTDLQRSPSQDELLSERNLPSQDPRCFCLDTNFFELELETVRMPTHLEISTFMSKLPPVLARHMSPAAYNYLTATGKCRKSCHHLARNQNVLHQTDIGRNHLPDPHPLPYSRRRPNRLQHAQRSAPRLAAATCSSQTPMPDLDFVQPATSGANFSYALDAALRPPQSTKRIHDPLALPSSRGRGGAEPELADPPRPASQYTPARFGRAAESGA